MTIEEYLFWGIVALMFVLIVIVPFLSGYDKRKFLKIETDKDA